jgi:predicted nuclease of predicted toxin-antitoxin system
VKLLLDENLSRRMVPRLTSAYPGTTQVALLGMERASDREIWQFARDQGYVIVTQDADFHELCVLHGAPPKVIWLQTGNQSRHRIAELLLNLRETIENLLADEETTFIQIG